VKEKTEKKEKGREKERLVELWCRNFKSQGKKKIKKGKRAGKRKTR
jgi:hypothetical protein